MERRAYLGGICAASTSFALGGCLGALTDAQNRIISQSAASWPTYRRDPARTGYAPEAQIPDSPDSRWTYEPARRVNATPVVTDGAVYVADPWTVYALDRESGGEQWQFQIREPTDVPCIVEGCATVTDAGVMVGTCEGVHLLDTADGTVRWHNEAIRDANIHPVVTDDRGYLSVNARARPVVFAVDQMDGSVEPVLETGANELTTAAVASGRMYVVGTGESGDDEAGKVYAAGLDGQVTWEHTLDGTVYATPAVSEGMVYVAGGKRGESGQVVALDAKRGDEQWTYETSSVVETPVAVTPETVYVAADGGRLDALDATNGSERWSYDLPDRTATAPAAARNGVCVASADGTLHAIDTDGVGRWTASLETASYYAGPVLVGDHVLVGGRTLAAFGPS